MSKLRIKYSLFGDDGDETEYFSIKPADAKRFNVSILGLGSIASQGKPREVLAAIFDLEGFTNFCSQADPHLFMPVFLGRFLDWIFKTILNETICKESGGDVLLWTKLPFYAKFTGDGVLFLWDLKNTEPCDVGNMVMVLDNVCDAYRNDFLPKIRNKVVKPPSRLRCGAARGRVVSVGSDMDYVGPCINTASRLQKLEKFSFAFLAKGIDLGMFAEVEQKNIVLIKYPIRGVGDEELIYVKQREFNSLSDKQKTDLAQT